MIMAESQNAKPYNISLYPKHIDKIQKHKKENNISTDAASLQNIIDQYFKKKSIDIKRDIIILIVYPIILCSFSLYGSRSISKIIDKLLAKNYTHIGELATLETIYTAFGFITLGILVTCIYIFLNNFYNRGTYGD